MPESNPSVVHLCIATDQILANALPLRLLPWQEVIVVASDHFRLRNAARLNQFLRWAQEEAQRRSLDPVTSVRQVDLQDTGLGWGGLLAFARSLADDMAQTHQGYAMDVNVTGGTKLMTQAFSTAFAGMARLVYCNTQGETLEVLDASGVEPPIALPADLMTLNALLSAQGYEVMGAQTMADCDWYAGLEQRRALTLALVLEGQRLRMASGVKGKKLLNVLHGMAVDSLPRRAHPAQPFQTEVQISAPDTPVWQAMLKLLEKHGVARIVDSVADQSGAFFRLVLAWANEDAARYLGGGYLEEYAFLCAQSLGLPASQFASNVRLRPHNSSLPEGHEYQELDLAVVWRNRLWVFECKAGVQLHTGKGQDILNKLDSLKGHIGGAMGEGWLLTPLPLRDDFDGHIHVIERAHQYGIRLVHASGELAKLPLLLSKALGGLMSSSELGHVPFELRHALAESARLARENRSYQ